MSKDDLCQANSTAVGPDGIGSASSIEPREEASGPMPPPLYRAKAYDLALTPSLETKAAFMGEFQIWHTEIDEDGNEHRIRLDVPWDTVKWIMSAIRKKAEEINHRLGCAANTQSPIEEPQRGDTDGSEQPGVSLTPHDLEQKAREIAAAQSWRHPDDDGRYVIESGFLADLILVALREERERCAKIVCRHCRDDVPVISVNTNKLGHERGATIYFCDAAAIRGEDNG